MNTRHKTIALLLGVLMFSMMPLNVSAATKTAPPQAGYGVHALLATQTGGVSVPVTGTTSKGGKFIGAFKIREFSLVNDKVVAVGTLTGTIQNAVGNVIGTVLRTIALPVIFGQATCDILHLELGPLDLNLLGLEVHLNRIVLDIDADPTGGLLGALLCAVANLINTTGVITGDLVGPLNQILGLL
ncbi:MAG TPA: hypothetical protein VF527_12515 [Pyrinomonadaceae bacterium]|jgi:hypothetical protein